MKQVSLLIHHLMVEVRNSTSTTGRITADVMKALWTVFQAPLMGALDIVDRRAVVRVTSPNGRIIFQITGKTGGVSYTCLPTTDYCSCLAFRYSVLKHEEFPMCKHVLAARLAEAMHLCEEKFWTDQQISQALSSID